MTDKDILLSDLNDISEILNNNGYGGWCASIRKAVALLKEQEGSWISVPHKKARICSRCYDDEPYKFADEDADVYDYCPNCGARMTNRR